jgi:hypothetical protein
LLAGGFVERAAVLLVGGGGMPVLHQLVQLGDASRIAQQPSAAARAVEAGPLSPKARMATAKSIKEQLQANFVSPISPYAAN